MTLDKVILALGYRGKTCVTNFQYDALYVAFSRVHDRKDIRILVPKRADWTCLNYIYNLQPNPAIDSYFKGYNKEGATGTWNENVALASYRRATAPLPRQRRKRRLNGRPHA